MTEASAEPGQAPGPPSSTPEPRPRYRGLQVASIALIVAGIAIGLAVLQANPGLLSGEGSAPNGSEQGVALLTWLVLAGAALMVGLVMNAVRSIVVRETLPPDRYRGPSIVVLLLLAIVAANLASVAVASDVAALFGSGDGQLSVVGTLIILTVTQLGLLAAAALFVLAPRALAGLRLVPPRGLGTSVAIGLGAALPAWIGAQLIGYVAVRILELFGMEPETGVAEVALSRADPVVLVFALVVVAPVAEETFFRAVAYTAWLREYGPTRALLGSAILFALIHGSIFLVVPIAALGIVLGLVYRATGSLPAAIALHAGFNAITVTLGLLARYNVIDIPIT